mgnify:CR=1
VVLLTYLQINSFFSKILSFFSNPIGKTDIYAMKRLILFIKTRIMTDIVITSAKRTAIGKFSGSLSGLS